MPGCRGAGMLRRWGAGMPGCGGVAVRGCMVPDVAGLRVVDFRLWAVGCGLGGLRRGAEAEGGEGLQAGLPLRLWTLAVWTLAVGRWRAGVELR